MTKKLTEEKKRRLKIVTDKKEKDFIKKAKKIHNNKFDYSKVQFKTMKTKVTIICSKHGEFKQPPYSHLKSKKCCPFCSRKKINTESWIEDAKKIHGNKFIYSKVKYINSETEVVIICPIHGEFTQIPYTHLQSKKCCPSCVGNIKKTLTQFIKEANQIHNNKYDYSEFNYINARTKGIIICPKHGRFDQIPDVHINQNCGCRKCGFISSSKIQRNSQQNFIQKVARIHNHKFNYSKVNYQNCDTNVIIICPDHGEFQQTPYLHINTKYGCSKCSGNFKKTVEEFIKQAKLLYNDKYDYSKIIELNGMHSIIQIICKTHGVFTKSADSFLNGKSGCPKCSKNGTSKIAQEWINFLLVQQPNLRHFYSENGEYKIKNTNYKADGFNSLTKTIYEFHGDFWHGNPNIYSENSYNPVCKNTFGFLYNKTLEKKKKCLELGFNYQYIWENDWIRGKRAIKKIQSLFRKN